MDIGFYETTFDCQRDQVGSDRDLHLADFAGVPSSHDNMELSINFITILSTIQYK